MEIDYHKLLEWLTGKSLKLSQDEHTTKYAIKKKMTKKEYKLVLHLFSGGQISEIAEKLHLDEKRANETLDNAKKKIRSNLGQFAAI